MHKDDALLRFEYMMEYRNLSRNTIHMYSWFVSKFFDFCSCDDVSTLTYLHAQQFIIHLKGDYSPQSLNAVISAIRYFFDTVLQTPLSRRQFPNILYTKKEIFIFSDAQIHSLLDTKDVRLRAFILLGLDSGFRVGEVARLKISDIDSKSPFKTLHIRNSKRNKSRIVPMSDVLHKALQDYWKVYRTDPNGYLFVGKDSSHINQNYINNIFKSYLKQFDFYSDDIRFHNLRDTYATLMLRNGCNIFTLKKLLGHNSFSSTARYIKCDISDLESAPTISKALEIDL